MKLSISNKYALSFGVISLIISAVVAGSFITLLLKSGNSLRRQIEVTERQSYEESQGKTNYNLVNYLSSYLFVPLYQLDIDDINRLIKDMKKAVPIVSFLVTDPFGKVLTDGTKQNNSYGIQLKVDARHAESVNEEKTPEGREITFPIKAGNTIAGYGQVVFSDAPLAVAIQRQEENLSASWQTFTNDFVRISILGSLIVLLIAAVLSFIFSRTLSQPLIVLKNATDGVARGDLSHQVTIDSEDEIGDLAASFNRMVSDLKISTERLQQANQKLQTLDRLKSEFISVVSHELRTPITSVKAFAELILMRPSMVPEKKTRFLQIISAESERLARLITDILDITKIEAGKLYWRMSELSLDDVIRPSVSGMRPLVDDKDISVSVIIEPNLPKLKGDQDRLVQVVTNILSNAIKFTPPGGRIRIRAFRENEPAPALTVAISDTGVGIPEDSLHLIFEKFHRARGDLSHAFEGTGLGLAIARQIIEYHGGVIFASNNDGPGSTITFTIPVKSTIHNEKAEKHTLL